ncbi:efflux RND transporter periplasmic adaptor subunit [Pontibacter liquoris]|uniref:efflux RND transporter periplasmic adaptor subunit n=1 Tax=Pontibacter liquoris TaxID=2905677 RepID=UPI001FA7CCE7|nr:efflux RND transporter periplasmic adaptor subunit [Pontibacter liquoris]
MRITYAWLLAAIMSPAILASCGGKEDVKQQNPAAMAVPVTAYPVKKQAVTGTDTYPGNIVSLQEVELRPQVSGYITNIFVQDGQRVTKGQKLYEIDRTRYQAAYQQAKANLQSAQANLERNQKDLQRYETLEAREAIAKQQVDYARTNVQTAQAQVAAARAQVSSAANELSYAIITAPFDGVIGISNVRVGAQVSPGQPLLNTIYSMAPIAADFVINEQEVPRFANYMSNPKAQPDSLFTIALNNGQVYPHVGKLITVDRSIGRQSGTTTVRVEFPNPERQLIPGMTVDVRVLNQDIGQQVVIPYKAVTEQLGEYFVYVIQGDSVHQQNVQLGTRFNGNVVVREGLAADQNIVLEGIQKLREGAKVQVGDAAAQQQAPAKR